MSFQIRIDAGHGEAVTVDAEGGDTILDALLMAGEAFSYSCQAGNCGTCRCELLSGDVLELESSEHALSGSDRRRGFVLACRTQVWSDVVIRQPDEEEFVVHPSRMMQCVVSSFERVAADVLRLRLRVVSGGPFSFSAGQHAVLEFPFAPGRLRHFSLANRPDEAELEFHIRDTGEGSEGRPAWERLGSGDTVRVEGPHGSAYLRQRHTGPVVAVAGGTGLAPVRSILRTLAVTGSGGAPVHLYVGARTREHLYGIDELSQCLAAIPGSRLHVVLSEEAGALEPGWRHGLVTDALAEDLPDLTGFVAYLAGPGAMVAVADALVRSRGVAARDVHADGLPAPAARSGALEAA